CRDDARAARTLHLEQDHGADRRLVEESPQRCAIARSDQSRTPRTRYAEHALARRELRLRRSQQDGRKGNAQRRIEQLGRRARGRPREAARIGEQREHRQHEEEHTRPAAHGSRTRARAVASSAAGSRNRSPASRSPMPRLASIPKPTRPPHPEKTRTKKPSASTPPATSTGSPAVSSAASSAPATSRPPRRAAAKRSARWIVSSTPTPIRIAPTIVWAGPRRSPDQPIKPISATTGSTLATIAHGTSIPWPRSSSASVA